MNGIEANVMKVISPHGGPTRERQMLAKRFARRMSTDDFYCRRTVSYQGNRKEPGLRWMKYKEGFSKQLAQTLIETEKPKTVLDPFAGICTTPLVASSKGLQANGIEIMPIGVLAGKAMAEAANGLSRGKFVHQAHALLKEIRTRQSATHYSFPHVRITEGAFSPGTEKEIARARRFLANLEDNGIRLLLELACVSVLEAASYTRKDGQYLRWDRRASRSLRSSVDLGPIPKFSDALEERINEIEEDISALKSQFGGACPTLITGSCLDTLKDFQTDSIDLVITSPPYANRYDYTRTYALELAWLGFDQDGCSTLRQRLLSATVENKTKRNILNDIYRPNRSCLNHAIQMYEGQGAIHEVLNILRSHAHELSNKNVLTLIEQYFFEMAVVISELGRIVRPGGVVYMVNDNVQYHGEELPVDFMLSDFAESTGFQCTNIWKLARGKGNSSQQMARFGRREMRKCVYRWVQEGD